MRRGSKETVLKVESPDKKGSQREVGLEEHHLINWPNFSTLSDTFSSVPVRMEDNRSGNTFVISIVLFSMANVERLYTQFQGQLNTLQEDSTPLLDPLVSFSGGKVGGNPIRVSYLRIN